MQRRSIAAGVLTLLVGSLESHGQCVHFEVQALGASDESVDNRFGQALEIDGDRALVSAYLDDELGMDVGAVYVLEHDGRRWVEVQKILSPDPVPHQHFGSSVSLDGDRAVIGARDADAFAGTAYAYRRIGGVWTLEQRLFASDRKPDQQFGLSVAIDGEHIAVSAPHDDSQGEETGAVYLFQLDAGSGTWNEIRKLVPNDTGIHSLLGFFIALDGDVLVSGAPMDTGDGRGKAYVHRFDGTNWRREKLLRASDRDPGDEFGWGVDVHGDRIVVGALHDGDVQPLGGSAYVFEYDGTNWNEVQKLVPGDPGADFKQYGVAVDLSADGVLVGAFGDDERATHGGAAYAYRHDGTRFVLERKWVAETTGNAQLVGAAVALDGSHALVGTDDFGDPGRAYAFELSPLALNADPTGVGPGATLSLQACGGQPSGPVLLALAEIDGSPLFIRLQTRLFDAAGEWQDSFTVPAGLSGHTVALQVLGFEALGPLSFSHLRDVVLQ